MQCGAASMYIINVMAPQTIHVPVPPSAGYALGTIGPLQAPEPVLLIGQIHLIIMICIVNTIAVTCISGIQLSICWMIMDLHTKWINAAFLSKRRRGNNLRAYAANCIERFDLRVNNKWYRLAGNVFRPANVQRCRMYLVFEEPDFVGSSNTKKW